MKLVVDENFPRPSVELLRNDGHEVVEVAETAPGSADIEVIALARRNEAVLVTLDRDHGELIFLHGAAAPLAVIFLRGLPANSLAPAYLMRPVLQRPDLIGGMWVVDPTAIRRRPLPASGSSTTGQP